MRIGVRDSTTFTSTTGRTVAIHPCFQGGFPILNDVGVIRLDTPASGDAFPSYAINRDPELLIYNGLDLQFYGK